jgi:hypothetical protein
MSAITREGVALVVGLGMAGFGTAALTGLTFAQLPTSVPLTIGAGLFLADTTVLKLVPTLRVVRAIRSAAYGCFYLIAVCLAGITAAYSTQRFGLPLQHEFFVAADRALGFDWFVITHWVDDHPLPPVLQFAYDTMSIQIVLPVMILALLDRDPCAATYWPSAFRWQSPSRLARCSQRPVPLPPSTAPPSTCCSLLAQRRLTTCGCCARLGQQP